MRRTITLVLMIIGLVPMSMAQSPYVNDVLALNPLGYWRLERFLNQGGVADAVIGGWELGSIFTLQSGFPETVAAGIDQSNTNITYDRVNATGQHAVLPRGTKS